MPEKPKIIYRVLVAAIDSDDNAYWDCWSTWDEQAKAYAAMAEYREEWGRKDFTPIRIVRCVMTQKLGVQDETFIDETGTSIIEWKRMVNAGEFDAGDR